MMSAKITLAPDVVTVCRRSRSSRDRVREPDQVVAVPLVEPFARADRDQVADAAVLLGQRVADRRRKVGGRDRA